ncbi:chitobiosyldiphosphodolichol beta-mannosyltransferase [Pyxicephalus adspersus]|uniref:chitobiosyldiphosphodolichol beta-mannosyltransferase n=1 Tax=Pyxicephalus adspersus TaxID=30357 RepID=UPI003B5A4BA7
MAAVRAPVTALVMCTVGVLWSAVSGSLCLFTATLCAVIVLALFCTAGDPKRVCVLVLGDVGRSPRMTYHALSLARNGYDVSLVGFRETDPHKDVLNNEKIKIRPMSDFKGVKGNSRMNTCVEWLVTYLYFIISMTNVNQTKVFLFIFSCFYCRADTLYDTPALIFKETPIELQHQLFMKLAKDYAPFEARSEYDKSEFEKSVFTELNRKSDIVKYNVGRPALLISSTSWTEDEDFSVLLRALQATHGTHKDTWPRQDIILQTVCSLVVLKKSYFPNTTPIRFYHSCFLFCLSTGKGPLKEYYCKLIKELQLQNIHICTPWLEAEDYPVLLGSADLGVCLHKSSSGLDLPMKVVDMFGCCLPVCAVNFKCLPELVKHKENGLIFEDSKELAEQLKVKNTYFRFE